MEIELLRIKSESPEIMTVYLGPSNIAEIIIGTKLKLIVSNGVLIDKNLESTTDNASNNAESIIFFVFDISSIKKLLS